MTYRIYRDGILVESAIGGNYAGIKTVKIFGRLTCWSGIQKAKRENRVFFETYEDAIGMGYRPCKVCQPQKSDHYIRNGEGHWQLVNEITL